MLSKWFDSFASWVWDFSHRVDERLDTRKWAKHMDRLAMQDKTEWARDLWIQHRVDLLLKQRQEERLSYATN